MKNNFEGAGTWAYNTMAVVVGIWVINDWVNMTPDPNYQAFGKEDAEWFSKVLAIGTVSAAAGAGAKIAKNILTSK